MKKFFLFLSISLITACCKDDPASPKPCNPLVLYINEDLETFLPDSFYSSLKYKNSINEYFYFTDLIIHRDTLLANDTCLGGGEYGSYTYKTINDVKEFEYHIDGADSNLLTITIGPDESPFICESKFYIVTDSIGTSIDTLELLNSTFYNVYHRNTNFGSGNCCTEIYYNMQYGVVGFNWQGEWYVLETDSL